MTSNVRVISPDQTIGEAAALMFKENIGALPVGERDHLIGMITDRDIAIRGVGQGKGHDTAVREIMSFAGAMEKFDRPGESCWSGRRYRPVAPAPADCLGTVVGAGRD